MAAPLFTEDDFPDTATTPLFTEADFPDTDEPPLFTEVDFPDTVGAAQGVVNSFRRGQLAVNRTVTAGLKTIDKPTKPSLFQQRRAHVGAMTDPRYMDALLTAGDDQGALTKAEALYGPPAKLGAIRAKTEAVPQAYEVDIATDTAAMNALPRSDTMRRWDKAKDADIWRLLASTDGPEIVANIIAESLPQSAPALAAGLAVGPVGLGAGVAATAGTVGVASAATEYASSYLQVAEELGYDLTDEKDVRTFFTNPDAQEVAKATALARGVPVGVMSAIGYGIAGKFMGPALGKGVARVAGAGVLEAGAQMAAEGLGETLAQVASRNEGEPLSKKEIVAEMIGSLGDAPVEIVSNLRREMRPVQMPPRLQPTTAPKRIAPAPEPKRIAPEQPAIDIEATVQPVEPPPGFVPEANTPEQMAERAEAALEARDNAIEPPKPAAPEIETPATPAGEPATPDVPPEWKGELQEAIDYLRKTISDKNDLRDAIDQVRRDIISRNPPGGGGGGGGGAAPTVSTRQISTAEFINAEPLQPRADKFSETTASKVETEGFKPQESAKSPPLVWRDPNTGKLYRAGGSSRAEGLRRLGRAAPDTVDALFSDATSKQAAFEEAIANNMVSAPENIVDTASAVRKSREEGIEDERIAQLRRVSSGDVGALAAFDGLPAEVKSDFKPQGKRAGARPPQSEDTALALGRAMDRGILATDKIVADYLALRKQQGRINPTDIERILDLHEKYQAKVNAEKAQGSFDLGGVSEQGDMFGKSAAQSKEDMGWQKFRAQQFALLRKHRTALNQLSVQKKAVKGLKDTGKNVTAAQEQAVLDNAASAQEIISEMRAAERELLGTTPAGESVQKPEVMPLGETPKSGLLTHDAAITAAATELGRKVVLQDKPPEPGTPLARAIPPDKVIAYPNPDGSITVNRPALNRFLEGVPEEDRPAAIRSLIHEEAVHSHVSNADATLYWDSLTAAEQALIRRGYGGKAEGRPTLTDAQLGHEALRIRLQQLAGMTPRDLFGVGDMERLTTRVVLALQRIIQNIREALGTKASKLQTDMLDAVQAKLDAAKAQAGIISADNATVVPPLAFLKAHHSTPHDVDKFSTRYIGAGEAGMSLEEALAGDNPAGAVGWGIYFAEDEAVSGVGGAYYNRFKEKHGKANSYTVTLNVEPDELLDWDKPMSEQSEKVKAAAARFGMKPGSVDLGEFMGGKVSGAEPTGQGIYDAVAAQHATERRFGQGATQWSGRSPNSKAASEALAALGIKGIRYLDQGSRRTPNRQDIIRPNGTRAGVKWEADGKLFESKAEAQAHLDTQNTHNYVIFDENDITITHKNGQEIAPSELSKQIQSESAATESGEPPMAFLRDRLDNIRNIGSGASKLAKLSSLAKGIVEIGRLYSEWMTERIRRAGGPAATTFSRQAEAMIADSARINGEFSNSTGDAALNELGKLGKATTWLNRFSKKHTPDAAERNVQGALEGYVDVPEFARHTVATMDAANRESIMPLIGLSHLDRPLGKMHRIFTGRAVDIIRQGSGTLHQRWAEGLAAANGLPVEQVLALFAKMKKAMDDPLSGADDIQRVNQDFERHFQRAITDVRDDNGAWIAVIHAEPFSYIQRSALIASKVAAFRKFFPATDEGRALFKRTMERVRAELPAGPQEDLKGLIRSLAGHPTDDYTGRTVLHPAEPIGSFLSIVNDTLLRLAKAAVLTGQMIVQPSETLTGGSAQYFGLKRTTKANALLAKDRLAQTRMFRELIESRDIYSALEKAGSRNAVIYNWALDPNAPWRSAARIGSNLLSKGFATNFLNELQEAQNALIAKMVVEDINAGRLTSWDKRKIPLAFKSMGFTERQAARMLAGEEPELLAQFQQKAAAFLSGGNVQPGQGSRFGQNRQWMALLPWQRYPMTKLNHLRTAIGNFQDALQSRQRGKILAATESLARLVFYNTLQGTLLVGIKLMFTGGLSSVVTGYEEAKDEPVTFLIEMALASMSGPLYLIWSGARDKGLLGPVEQLGRVFFPYSMARGVMDMTGGYGPYRDKDWFSRIGLYLQRMTPGTKPIRVGLSVAGLSKYDYKTERAISAFYRFQRDEPGYQRESGGLRNADSRARFRTNMRKAVNALMNDDNAAYKKAVSVALEEAEMLRADELQKRSELVAAGVPVPDQPPDAAKAVVASSLQGQQILKTPNRRPYFDNHGNPLQPDAVQRLTKRIGADAVERLKSFDLMLREVARETEAAGIGR